MARVIDADTLAQLRAGRVARTELILFDFPAPTGQVGFFSGVGTFTWEGITFQGAGTLFELSAVGGSSEGAAVPLTIRLNGDARSGLDASVLAQIETVQYRGRPCFVWRAYLHPDSYALISVESVFRGKIDTISHTITEGGDAFLECSVESNAIDLGRSGYRVRTDIDQRLIDPSDGSLAHVQTTATQKIDWSKLAPVQQKKSKFLGVF